MKTTTMSNALQSLFPVHLDFSIHIIKSDIGRAKSQRLSHQCICSTIVEDHKR